MYIGEKSKMKEKEDDFINGDFDEEFERMTWQDDVDVDRPKSIGK